MTKFVYLFTGGQMAETPEAQEESMRVWGAWFGGLGDSVVDMGNPFGAGIDGHGRRRDHGRRIEARRLLDRRGRFARRRGGQGRRMPGTGRRWQR